MSFLQTDVDKHSSLVLKFTQINNYELNYFHVPVTLLSTQK